MNKTEFLEKLKRRLSMLKDDEIADILLEYGGYIDEKIKKKKISEEKAIEEFGDFDELVSEILSAYKIDDEKSRASSKFINFFDEIGDLVEKVIKDFSGKSADVIARFVFEMFVVLIIIGIFRIPISIFIELGEDLFFSLPAPIDSLLGGLWKFIFEICYFILAIMFFFKMFKIRYYQYIKSDKKAENVSKNKKEEEKEEIKEDEEKPVSAVIDKPVKKIKPKKEANNEIDSLDFGIGKTFTFLAMLFVKTMVAFFLIPTIVGTTALIVAFCIGVAVYADGVHYLGILVCLLACIIFGIIVVEMLIKFLFSAKIKAGRVFGTIIATIILLGIGASMSAFEVANSTFVNTVPSGYTKKVISEEYNKEEVTCIECYYHEWRTTNYTASETMGDKIRIEVTYYEEFINPRISLHEKNLDIYKDYEITYPNKKMYNLIIDNLKNKTLYNYEKLFNIEVEIIGSQENINKFLEERNNYELNNIYDELNTLREQRDEWQTKYYDLLQNNNIDSNCNYED